MKVLHVSPSIDLKYGGLSTVVLEIVNALCRADIEILLATTFPPDKRDTISLDVLEVPYFVFPSKIGSKWGVSLELQKWMAEEIKKFDLVHIHSVFSFSSNAAARICQKLRVPYIISPHGILDPYGMKQKWLKKALYFHLIERRNLEQASCIHCASDYEKQHIAKIISHRRIQVVPFGTYEPIEKGRKDLPITKIITSNKKHTVLFLGRLDPKKGLELLLESVRILKRKRDDFILTICGSGEKKYTEEIERLVRSKRLEDHVVLYGFLNKNEKTLALSSATCFVLPSLDENFGVSVLEAMACGLPVIISDRVGLGNEIKNNTAGMVKPLDSEEFAGSINYLLDKPDIRRLMSERAKILVEKEYRWPKLAVKYKEMYTGILEKAKSGYG